MATTEIILALIALVSAPVGGWLAAKLLRRKYDAEVAKLQAEVAKLQADVKAAQINTRGDELDNVKKAMEILMEQVVEPLKREINGIRRELSRFCKAVEQANTCSLRDNCPVRNELQKSERIDTVSPQCRQPDKQHKRIRADTATRDTQRGTDDVSDEDTGCDTGGHRL